jgi:phospholipase A-2-activating protein
MLATLPDHENSVCVVGLLPNSTSGLLSVATGSAGIAQNNAITNHSVRLWTIDLTTGGVKLVTTVANDHEGPIRGMALIHTGDDNNQQQQLATCSNDGTVKMRQVESGECTATLAAFATVQQEAPMLLSVTATSSSVDTVAAASAEDGNVVFYKHGGGESQLIRHGASVWQVLSLANGDVATSCQDGYVRIFTQATDRMASQDVRDEFAAAVQAASAATAAAGGPSPEEVAKLPKWELNALQQGKKEGQVQCFQKDGVAIAAQWSAASATWIEVGQVVSGPGGSSSSSTIDGVEYDHVLPIEVDQEGGGVAKLQIGRRAAIHGCTHVATTLSFRNCQLHSTTCWKTIGTDTRWSSDSWTIDCGDTLCLRTCPHEGIQILRTLEQDGNWVL